MFFVFLSGDVGAKLRWVVESVVLSVRACNNTISVESRRCCGDDGMARFGQRLSHTETRNRGTTSYKKINTIDIADVKGGGKRLSNMKSDKETPTQNRTENYQTSVLFKTACISLVN